MTDFTDELIRVCRKELEVFNDGEKKEWMDDVYLAVGKYWDELSKIKKYEKWKGYNGKSDIKFDSKGIPLPKMNQNQPWSAAFISYVMKKAGAGDAFSYSPSHSVYIVKALKEASKTKSSASFIARRHGEYVPKLGDLVACERQIAIDPSFDTYIDWVQKDKYEAHCGVVVDISEDEIVTIGGNVSNSVKRKYWPLKSGKINGVDPLNSNATVICIIECLL